MPMQKNVKNAIILGGLGLVMFIVYGKSLFKGSPSSTSTALSPEIAPAGEENVSVPGTEPLPQEQKPKRVPAGWGRDPFVAEEVTPTKLTKVQPLRKLYLSGIADKDGVYSAIIDGKIANKGDIIDGREIINITGNSVTLKKNDKIEILKLKGD
jgi:hypothetical protein